ncbi:hypothetical protein LTS10_001360 [Elasticomyces elasticus]|nr:hypothetical protein LTS10_001360 [Elasticomyces elasticus]
MGNENGLTDREAAIDAIIRFVNSLDDGDSELLSSALTEDVVVDLTPFNKSGFNFSVLASKASVIDRMIPFVGTGLDTTHHTSNFRVKVTADTATLSCHVLAQHFRKDEGPLDAFQDCYMMGNRYQANVVRDGALWKIEKIVISAAWTQGNIGVLQAN